MASLLLFAVPASARTWRGLGWRFLICAGLTLATFLIVTGGRFSLQVPGGDADIGAGIVLFYALATFGSGLVSRTLSLTAAHFGHARPWSLWIEAVGFVALPAALVAL